MKTTKNNDCGGNRMNFIASHIFIFIALVRPKCLKAEKLLQVQRCFSIYMQNRTTDFDHRCFWGELGELSPNPDENLLILPAYWQNFVNPLGRRRRPKKIAYLA